MTLVQAVTKILSLMTILAQFITLAIIAALISRRKKQSKKFLGFASKKALKISFIVALVATLGSLFYSEIAGYEPCKLCWFQRILMYPQVILLGIALWKKDRRIAKYILPLAALGIIIASYHYYIQLGGTPLTSCDVANSCAKRYTFNFGYITLPMMALSAFSLIFALMLIQPKKNQITS